MGVERGAARRSVIPMCGEPTGIRLLGWQMISASEFSGETDGLHMRHCKRMDARLRTRRRPGCLTRRGRGRGRVTFARFVHVAN